MSDSGEQNNLNKQHRALKISGNNLAVWQREALQGEQLSHLLDYWTQHLSGFETLNLPTDLPRTNQRTYCSADERFELTPALSDSLRQLARENETTLYSVLLSGFYVTLSVLSGQEDLVVGTPSDNRSPTQTQPLIGYFINSLALRLVLEGQETVGDLLQKVHQIVTQGKVHQQLPFETLVDQLKVVRDQTQHPIFQVMFGVQDFESSELEGAGFKKAMLLESKEGATYSPTAKFDLSLFLSDSEAAICGEFNYATDLFKKPSIVRMIQLYKMILKALVEDSQAKISAIEVVTEEERQQLLVEWNQTTKDYPKNKTLHQLFEAHAEDAADRIALVFEDVHMSYQTLNQHANQVAHQLRYAYQRNHSKALGRDTLVALYLDRGPAMIVAILATLKAGAAYVPISPDYPASRIKYMLEDTDAPIVLCESHYRDSIAELLEESSLSGTVLSIDNDEQQTKQETSNLTVTAKADDLAYVIYTSGTTGTPKGVMISHANVVNTIYALQPAYSPFNHEFKATCYSNYVFDVSVSEIFNVLCFGGELHLLNTAIRNDVTALSEYVKNYCIYTLFLPPKVLALFPEEPHPSVHNIIFAGEACDSQLCQYWSEHAVLHDYYGPTEATIYATGQIAKGINLNLIGRAISNNQVYVLNSSLQLVPPGTAGELYIGGAGLARGYLNQPELTAKAFIKNPYATASDIAQGNDRLYKTGDRVRWLASGQLEYLGRNDDQVKLRGLRIELGEIETALMTLPAIKQAVVLARDNHGEKYLAAYWVSSSNERVSEDELYSALCQLLPDYMVPSSFTQLTHFPLTVNGKLDKRALPVPVLGSGQAYVSARNPLEASLCQIWEALLGVERVGIYDNYFRIGGNSITAMRLIAQCRQRLNKDIPLDLLFEHKTIAGIAAHLDEQELLTIPHQRRKKYPVSFSQSSLLFIERFEQGTDAYHIPVLMKLANVVSLDTVEQALNYLLERHPILKTIYRQDEQGNDYQHVADRRMSLTLQSVQTQGELIARARGEIGRPFNLQKEPGFRVCGYALGEERTLLFLWHHIAFDGWSTDIFWREFYQVYDALSQQTTPQLPTLEIDYGDYAVWQREYLQGERLTTLLDYWTRHLSGFETLKLPADFNSSTDKRVKASTKNHQFSRELSTKLNLLAKEKETTLYSVLLSGFYVTLSVLSGQKDIVVGTPSDNRYPAQTQSLIGYFVNSLALRLVLDTEETVDSLLEKVHTIVTQGKIHQQLPFETLVEQLQVVRDPVRHPIFQVMFGSEGVDNSQFEQSLFTPLLAQDEAQIVREAKFELSLFYDYQEPHINVALSYMANRFSSTTIARFSQIFERVLEAFVSRDNIPLSEIELLSEREAHQLLIEWNASESESLSDKGLHQLFEEQVELAPDSIALVFEGQHLSYQALNQRANQLARGIREIYECERGEGLSAETLIGLYLDRSLDMVVAILAVIKAGGAYVPISTEFPNSRVSLILDDSQAAIVLTQSRYYEKLKDCRQGKQAKPVILNIDESCLIANLSGRNLAISVPDNNLAYVIYTSGTTGQPKGVMIEHRSIVEHIRYQSKSYGFSSSERAFWLADYVFDASVEQLFICLANGASIEVLAKALLKDYSQVATRLIHSHITHLHATPSYLLALGNLYDSAAIRRVVSAGESCSDGLKQIWGTRLINKYGPTELTVSCIQSEQASHFPGVNCIGKPVDNTRVYIVSTNHKLVPIGVPGEIWVAGPCVARGYLNDASLTDDKFIANPFWNQTTDNEEYQWLYKTGDIGRWLESGNIEYLSRADTQIKLRGYRIELEEVNSALKTLPEITQASVILKEHRGEKILVAYFVCASNKRIKTAKLYESLGYLLPDYMLPTSFMQLESFPLTINGKIDIRALPVPVLKSDHQYIGARSALESSLCQIWQELLGIEKVGVFDNFFRIGGNSIIAMRLIARCRKVLNKDVPLELLFQQKNIAGIAEHINEQELLLIPHLSSDKYPVSYSQSSLLFIERFNQGTDAYHIPLLVKVSSDVSIKVVERTLNYLINRHQVLKSIYRTDKRGNDYQQVLDYCMLLPVLQMQDYETLLTRVKGEVSNPFDLQVETSFRAEAYQIKDERYILFLWHHIAFDGWSSNLFWREFHQVYSALIQHELPSLPDLEISYGDYAVWQREALQGEQLSHLLDYWTQHLSGFETLNLPTDLPRTNQRTYCSADERFELTPALSDSLRQLARENETTLYSVLLSGFYVTLSVLSGQEDLVVGTPSDNRSPTQTQPLIGYFINSLALRLVLEGQETVGDLLQKVHQIVTQGKVHQQLPFETLVDQLKVVRDQTQHPIFQVMFGVQDFESSELEGAGFKKAMLLESKEGATYSPTAKFDLSLFLSDSEAAICGEFNYATDLFKKPSIVRMIQLYKMILKALAVDSQAKISAIEVVTEEERQQLLVEWNQTTKDYPKNKTLHQLFEAHAEDAADRIALVFEDVHMSYQTLNQHANQVAHQLRYAYQRNHSKALGRDTLVALYLDRGPAMIVAILATLKAGAAYVPISPDYPASRIKYMLEDTDAPIVLCESHYRDSIAELLEESSLSGTVLSIDNDEQKTKQETSNLTVTAKADDLAYVIYTSGTTGTPKGVMISHASLSNYCHAVYELYHLQSEQRISQFSSFSFDISVEEICLSLASGSSLVFCDNKSRSDISLFWNFLQKNCISTTTLPTAFWHMLCRSTDVLQGKARFLRLVIIGGEKMSLEMLLRWQKHSLPSTRLLNTYGPTECTVIVSTSDCLNDLAELNCLPIGKLLANTHAYVLNSSLQFVPPGTAGELYIGGAGLARGYLNQPELTAKAFIKNPFATASDIAQGNDRLYKTGDRVRWLASGQLEYLGRNDDQVKLRGLRIELGEIETALMTLPAIKQAVVLARDNHGEKYLAAYWVGSSNERVSEDELYSALCQLLPDYMVPSSFTQLTHFPLTVNGKLDKRALPVPVLGSGQAYVGARNPLEASLCQIWEALLGVERVGIYDNYFRIGGNSITAMRLIAQCRQRLNKDIPLDLLFEHKTIAGIAAHLDEQELLTIPHQRRKKYPVSFSQSSLLFIERFEQGTDAYHIPVLMKLANVVSLDTVEQALNYLLERHPILKTIYRQDEQGNDYQHVADRRMSLTLQPVQTQGELIARARGEIGRPFNLQKEPGFRVCGYALGDERTLLFLWHHIAFDGWSTDIFWREFYQVYDALSQQTTPQLPTLEIDYGDYAVWQREYLQGERLTTLLDYWTRHLSGFETLKLPADFNSSTDKRVKASTKNHQFSRELSTKLNLLAKEKETTLYSVLLSGFYVTLSVLSGQKDIVVGTPSDNRYPAQTQSLIGYFVNSLALRLVLDTQETVDSLLEKVHTIVTQGKIHQQLPFETLVEQLQVVRDPVRHPIFQVMFGSEGVDNSQFEQSLFTPLLAQDEAQIVREAKFELSLFYDYQEPHINVALSYMANRFSSTTIARFSQIFERVLEAFVSRDNIPLSEIELLSEREAHQLLIEWNASESESLSDKGLHQLFEEQVELAPDSVALVFEGQHLSYQALNQRANQLARGIREIYECERGEGLSAETLIGLYLDRSLDMVVAILAVIKAGGAYVPISTEFPNSRVSLILDDSQAAIVLTQSRYYEKLKDCRQGKQAKPVILNIDESCLIANLSGRNLAISVPDNNLAYVIYTSGTTGQPKGVMIEHRSIVEHIRYQSKSYGFSSSERAFWLADYVFDASVEQLFICLANGASIEVLAKALLKDYSQVATRLIHSHITHLHATPSYLLALGNLYDSAAIRRVVSAGESCSDGLKQIWGTRLINKYGPTELTVSCIQSEQASHFPGVNSIGKPVDNTRVYIVSTNHKLVPIGVPGEIWVAGPCVARGYLNDASLTDDKFIANPFWNQTTDNEEYQWLYKTGDIGRWLESGNIEFLSRADTQIKLRGYRIELGEVESSISRLKDVESVAVLLMQRNELTYLAAYISVCEGVAFDEDLFREKVAKILPPYMVPNSFILMNKLPLTVNGKLDRSKLPEPTPVDDGPQELPENEIQAQLSDIWRSLLHISQPIGINENFFRLGGHSLLATKLANKIKEVFLVNVTLKEIFVGPEIKQLSKVIELRMKESDGEQAERVKAFHTDNEFEMEEIEL